MRLSSLRLIGVCVVLTTTILAPPASGVEVISGRLKVLDQCVLSDLQLARGEQAQIQEGIFAPILAGVVGSLAQSAVGGLASAIQSASEEHTYSAPATAGYTAGDIKRGQGPAPWQFKARDQCLIYYVQAPASRKAQKSLAFVRDAISKGVNRAGEDVTADALRDDLGMSDQEPIVYVEIALLSLREAVVIRPLLVWYRQPLPATRAQPQRIELNVALGLPGYAKDGDELGTLFAMQRFRLPPLMPGGNPLKFEDLTNLSSVYHPIRPTAGYLDGRVASLNTVVAAVDTARAAELAATRAHAAAKEKSDRNGTPENIAATQVAADALADARAQLHRAVTMQNDQSEEKERGVGATNARVTFMAIRDANKFGLAIAKALGAKQETVGETVTSSLTPQPTWQTSDTAFLTAMLDVQSKQAAHDAAVAKGDASEILAARNALLIAKAKANEAAIANNRSPPYPGVLEDGGI